MSDFDAKILLDIDDKQLSDVEKRLDALDGKQVTVDFKQQGFKILQDQLNSLRSIKIDSINIDSKGTLNVVQRFGLSAGRYFKKGFSDAAQGISDLGIQKLNTDIQVLETNFASLGEKGNQFSSRLSELRRNIDGFDRNAKVSEQISQFEKLQQEIADLSLKYKELNSSAKNSLQGLNLSEGKNILSNQVETWMNKNTAAAKEFESSLVELKQKIQSVTTSGELASARKQFNDIQTKASSQNILGKGIAGLDLQKLNTDIQVLETNFASLGEKGSKFSDKLRILQKEISNFDRSASAEKQIQVFEDIEKRIESLKLEYKELYASQKKVSDGDTLASGKTVLSNQITTWMNRNTKAAKIYSEQLEQLKVKLEQVTSKDGLKSIRTQFNEIVTATSASGTGGRGLLGTLYENMTKVSPLFGMGVLITRGISAAKSMFNNIVELDTALVDLQKTTKMNVDELNSFYMESNDVAKQLGVATAEIINQASAWSRLGYSSKESATAMSELSSKFAVISPGMSVDEATNGLVSVMKAFKIDVDDVLDGVMSKVNQIGNVFATSNSEIVGMLQKSSSAMSEANNTLDETIALETAAVEITRDYQSVGTAFKTIAMRIRGYDEETEEYIGNIEELSGKIANFTKTASTPGGLSLFTDSTKTTYKSTYQLLDEISKIYDQLTDKQQAGLLEALAGKRQGQIIAATISNFDAARKALDEMANSAGSADREMGIVQNSIAYKLNALKETFVGISQNLFAREDMKALVSGFTSVLDIIDKLTEKLGLFGTVGVIGGFTAFIKNFD